MEIQAISINNAVFWGKIYPEKYIFSDRDRHLRSRASRLLV